jgi:hypothetical protein
MIQRLVEKMVAAAQSGESLDPSAATSPHWSLAVDTLAEQGDLATLRDVLPILAPTFPDNRYLAFIAQLTAQAPTRLDGLPFANDPGKDFQAVIHPGSDCALLVFCGHAHRVGFPVGLAHHWFASLGGTVVYLRDYARMFFIDGIASIPGGYVETLAELRRRLAEMGIRRIFCYGNSAGVFSALRFGLDLGAEAVLAFSGPSNLMPAFIQENSLSVDYGMLLLDRLSEAIDLRPAFLRAQPPPRLRFYYGEDNDNDRHQAENLAGLPTVSLHPLNGYGDHNAIREVVMRGQFKEALHWLVGKVEPLPPPTLAGRLRRWWTEKRHIGLVTRSGMFDTDYYLRRYPDMPGAKMSPLTHYLRHGAGEGRNPSALFDTRFYLDTYPDVAQSAMNPLVHYILFGISEGRRSEPETPSGRNR